MGIRFATVNFDQSCLPMITKPKPNIQNPKLKTQNSKHQTPKTKIQNAKPKPRNPKTRKNLKAQNPKPQNPKPKDQNPKPCLRLIACRGPRNTSEDKVTMKPKPRKVTSSSLHANWHTATFSFFRRLGQTVQVLLARVGCCSAATAPLLGRLCTM